MDMTKEELVLLKKFVLDLMINMQTLTDKSTSHIAEMMMIGSTMGIINAIRNIADYNHAKKDIIKLMETLKAFEEKSYGDLQKFI